MAYIGIGYSGEQEAFLRSMAETHADWLKGDRQPRFYGDRFIVMYDSNTAREFAARCMRAAARSAVTVYPVGRPFDT